MDGNVPSGPPCTSLYADMIYWATKSDSLTPDQIPMRALFCLVASEWNTIVDYIRTRLGQIEWEVYFPEQFLNRDLEIQASLNKLYVWRRLIPIYRQMLTETLERIFQVKSDGTAIPLASGRNGQESFMVGPQNPMREEFTLVFLRMQEFLQRVDVLTSVVVSISESRKTAAGNQSVARLTWLATFFISLSFVTGLFSMTDDVGTLSQTMKWFFAAALPLAVASIALAVVLPSLIEKLVVGWLRRLKRWLR